MAVFGVWGDFECGYIKIDDKLQIKCENPESGNNATSNFEFLINCQKCKYYSIDLFVDESELKKLRSRQ